MSAAPDVECGEDFSPTGLVDEPASPASAASQPCDALGEAVELPLVLPQTSPQAVDHPVATAGGGSAAAAAAAAAALAAAAASAGQRVLTGIRVRSFSAGFSLGITVDVAELTRRIPNAEVHHKKSGTALQRFVVIRSVREPKWTAVVSTPGSVRIVTSLDEEATRMAAKRFARLVQQRYSASAAFRSFRVFNIQVAAQLPFRVDLESLAESLSGQADDPCLAVSGRTSVPTPAIGAGAGSGGSAGSFRCRLRRHSAASVELQVYNKEQTRVFVKGDGRLEVCSAKKYAAALEAMKAVEPLVSRHGIWW